MRGVVIDAAQVGGVDLIDADGAVHRGYGVSGAALLLVRPDGYVGVTTAAHDVAVVSDYPAALVSAR